RARRGQTGGIPLPRDAPAAGAGLRAGVSGHEVAGGIRRDCGGLDVEDGRGGVDAELAADRLALRIEAPPEHAAAYGRRSRWSGTAFPGHHEAAVRRRSDLRE